MELLAIGLALLVIVLAMASLWNLRWEDRRWRRFFLTVVCLGVLLIAAVIFTSQG